MLSATGRRVRLAALLAVAGLLLLGTLRGSDDAFPFGPFRMYAAADDPNGTVLSTSLVAVTEQGRTVGVTSGDIGLRRAEYEGQLGRLRPAVLGELAAVHSRRRPRAPRYRALRVVQTAYRLHDGVPGPRSERVLSSWQAP